MKPLPSVFYRGSRQQNVKKKIIFTLLNDVTDTFANLENQEKQYQVLVEQTQ